MKDLQNNVQFFSVVIAYNRSVFLISHHKFLTDAQPTSSEAEIYEVVKAVLDQSAQILQDLKDYQGANEPIRAVSDKLYYFISSKKYCGLY